MQYSLVDIHTTHGPNRIECVALGRNDTLAVARDGSWNNLVYCFLVICITTNSVCAVILFCLCLQTPASSKGRIHVGIMHRGKGIGPRFMWQHKVRLWIDIRQVPVPIPKFPISNVKAAAVD